MSHALLNPIKRYLARLENAQEAMLALYPRKRAALAGSRAQELLQLAESESRVVDELQTLVEDRQHLLEQAGGAGLPCESLLDVVRSIAHEEREALENRVQRSRQRSAELRHEGLIHWIIANRAFTHQNEMLELIANCGQKSPTYGGAPNQDPARGAILDASI